MSKSKWWLNPSGPNYSGPHRLTAGSDKPASRTVVGPATLEQVARDYRELLTAVSTKRQILAGGQSASLGFHAIDGKAVRVAVVTKLHPIFYTWHDRNVEHSAPEITVSTAFATEAELIAARSMVPAAQAGQIDVLLKMVRDGVTPPAPIRVQITNAADLQKDTILSIKRDDTGKMSGATAMKV